MFLLLCKKLGGKEMEESNTNFGSSLKNLKNQKEKEKEKERDKQLTNKTDAELRDLKFDLAIIDA